MMKNIIIEQKNKNFLTLLKLIIGKLQPLFIFQEIKIIWKIIGHF